MIIQELNYIENAENTNLEGGAVGINTGGSAVAFGPSVTGVTSGGFGASLGGIGFGGTTAGAIGALSSGSSAFFTLVIVP